MHDWVRRIVALSPQGQREPECGRWFLRLSGFECAHRRQLPPEAEFVRGRRVSTPPSSNDDVPLTTSQQQCLSLQVNILRPVLRLHGEEVPGHGRCACFSPRETVSDVTFRINASLVLPCRPRHQNPYSQGHPRAQATGSCFGHACSYSNGPNSCSPRGVRSCPGAPGR